MRRSTIATPSPVPSGNRSRRSAALIASRVARPTRRRRRHATTLVETAAVITVIGLLLGLITSVAIRIVRAESSTRNHAAELYARSQLADRFRTDIHRAGAVVVPQEEKGIMLRIDPETDRTIEYTVESQQVRRTVNSLARVVSQNAFRLPEKVRVKFEVFAIDERAFARIRVDEELSDRSLVECTAQVNRDRNLLERAEP